MIGLFGVAYEGRENFMPGASLAPGHIRFWLDSIENHSPLSGKNIEFEFLPDLLPGHDVKGKAFVEWALQALRRLDPDPPFIALGGDHLVSLPVCLFLREKIGEFTVVWLDAHLDARDHYLREEYNHATVAKRLVQAGFDLVHVGWRSRYPDQESEPRAADLSGLSGPLYISLDLDVLDPGVFPATGNPEAGGWSFEQLIQVLRELGPRAIAGDMVEYNPLQDSTGASGATAAKMLREMAGFMSKA